MVDTSFHGAMLLFCFLSICCCCCCRGFRWSFASFWNVSLCLSMEKGVSFSKNFHLFSSFFGFWVTKLLVLMVGILGLLKLWIHISSQVLELLNSFQNLICSSIFFLFIVSWCLFVWKLIHFDWLPPLPLFFCKLFMFYRALDSYYICSSFGFFLFLKAVKSLLLYELESSCPFFEL